MIKRKWRTLLISTIAILAPILYGLHYYSELPNQMVSHFNVNNVPDQWWPKPLMIFGLPIIMVFFQLVVVSASEHRTAKVKPAKRFTRVAYVIVPVISVFASIITIQFNLGNELDVGRLTVLLVSVLFIALGNYLPTVLVEGYGAFRWTRRSVTKSYTRIVGYSMVILGVLLLISLLFPSIVSLVLILAFIVWLFIYQVYTWMTGREKS